MMTDGRTAKSMVLWNNFNPEADSYSRAAKAGQFAAATADQYIYVHGKGALVLYFDGHVGFCDKVPVSPNDSTEGKLFWGESL